MIVDGHRGANKSFSSLKSKPMQQDPDLYLDLYDLNMFYLVVD